jgi:oligosaccharide repeat unit polymerase
MKQEAIEVRHVRRVLNPFTLFFLVWSICLIIIESEVINYIPLKTSFYIIFFAALGAFGLSYTFTYFLLCEVKSKRFQYLHCTKGRLLQNNRLIIRVLFAFTSTLIALHAWNFYSIAGGFDLGVYRTLITDEGESIKFGGIITLLNPFAYLSLVLMVAFNASKRQMYLMVILLLLFFILSTGRSAFLVVVLLTGWYLYFKGKINRRIIILLVLLFCVFFATMGLILGKLSVEVGDYMFSFINEAVPQNWFTIALFNILSYMTSGIVAFADYASTTAPLFEIYHVGKNFYKVFAPLIPHPPEFGILPNAFVPFPTNVFTFLFPAYADFGLIGIVATFLGYGVVGGALYTAFQVYRTEYYAALLAIYYSVISLSVFHDYVFSSLFPYSCFMLLFVLRKRLERKI